jgi:hypothetical protein
MTKIKLTLNIVPGNFITVCETLLKFINATKKMDESWANFVQWLNGS